ncbi:MAG: hypothetical protein MUF64_27675 [Polyangiaceae bacterium]|nr:hypothetical protein [Polyangiaceae bacterium]
MKQALGCSLWLALLLAAPGAQAQFGAPGMGPPPSAQGKPRKDPNAPETHAAPGADNDAIPKNTTSEPSLPDDPLALPKGLGERIGSNYDADGAREQTGKRTYLLAPPYFEEKAEKYRFRTLFPLWIDREKPGDQSSLYGLLYHRRRSERFDADVLFPFFWNLREDQDRTTIVGPLGWHRGPKSSDTFLAPLFFHGTRPDGHYLNIPPLLTFLKTDQYGGRSIIGPMYCFWRGGQTCNPETADSISYGVFPFYFARKEERSRYEIAPPLLHYYRYDEIDQSWINVWGPVIRAHSPEREAFHVAPFFFRLWGPNEEHITVPPLGFHYGYKGNERLLVTPLFVDHRSEKGDRTFVTWGYARHRGRTRLDMITPFYWDYEDPDENYRQKLLFPFLYSAQSPRESSVAFFPFYAHFKRQGLSESTWITPFFQHTRSVTGWETNLHPLVYIGRDRDHSHTVVAPFFWDFVTPTSRATVGFPVYWRFAENNTVTQVALNTYYREKKLRSGLDWEFHFFPFFSYGETPNGHWWNVLYGLAGYNRSGAASRMKLLWVPIQLSEDSPNP